MKPNPREVSTQLLNRDELQAGDDAQRARRVPGSSSRTTTGSATATTSPTDFIDVPLPEGDDWPDGDPMQVARDEPGPHPDRPERPAADLRQHRHALVGRLADLRLDGGAAAARCAPARTAS